VSETEVEAFIAKIKNSYGPYKGLEGEKLHEVIFATKPSSGACGKLDCWGHPLFLQGKGSPWLLRTVYKFGD
jgi:hypothetical protein